MKVALVSEWLDPWRGGAETSTLQFIHHLLDQGVDLHLFTRSRPSPIPGMAVNTVSGAAFTRTRQSITFAHRVHRQVREARFDVVHAISPCLGATVYQPRGGTVAETIQRNLAVFTHRPSRRVKQHANRFNFKQRYQLAIERKLLGRADGPVIIALSNYVARQLMDHYGVVASRIRLIRNGVDATAATPEQIKHDRAQIRHQFGIPTDAQLVLVVAHNFRLKGVARWMEAQRVLHSRGIDDVYTLVVGKGDAPRWHRLAKRLELSDRLQFIGPSDRVPSFRRAADVLVHPTYYDPCSRVVMEAMVDGLPCVTTRWDGASESIEHGRSGFVLDEPTDVEGLASCVERLRDPDVRRAMGEAAAAVSDRMNMQAHATSVLQLYRELASQQT